MICDIGHPISYESIHTITCKSTEPTSSTAAVSPFNIHTKTHRISVGCVLNMINFNGFLLNKKKKKYVSQSYS